MVDMDCDFDIIAIMPTSCISINIILSDNHVHGITVFYSFIFESFDIHDVTGHYFCGFFLYRAVAVSTGLAVFVVARNNVITARQEKLKERTQAKRLARQSQTNLNSSSSSQ